MSDVNLITDEQEIQLKATLLAAVKQANVGTDPSLAIAKAASDSGLNPQFTERLVEAFNSSKTLSHLNNSEMDKRAESFGLADKDVTLKAMYVPEKTAAVLSSDAYINFNKTSTSRVQIAGLEKAASDTFKTNIVERRPLLNTVLKQAHSKIRQYEEVGRQLNSEADYARELIVEAVKTAADTLTEYVNPHDFEDLERAVMFKLGEDKGRTVMNMIWNQKDFEVLGEKRASEMPKRPKFIPNDRYGESVNKVMNAIKIAREKKAQSLDFNKKANTAITAMESRMSALTGTKKLDTKDQASSLEKSAEGEEKKQPMGSVGLIKDVVGGKAPFVPTWLGEAVAGKGEEIDLSEDAIQEAELKKIRTQVMLNDMMANDATLSGYAPADIVNAYNQLSPLMPGLSANPLVMRNAIARVLQQQGHLDASEVQQLLSTERAAQGT